MLINYVERLNVVLGVFRQGSHVRSGGGRLSVPSNDEAEAREVRVDSELRAGGRMATERAEMSLTGGWSEGAARQRRASEQQAGQILQRQVHAVHQWQRRVAGCRA